MLMDFQINLWSFLLLMGAFQGLFISVIFISKSIGKNNGHLVFSILLVIFSIVQLDHATRLSALYLSFPYFLYTSVALWYLIAPLIYFFVKKSIHPSSFKLIDALHGIPFIIVLIIYWELLFSPTSVKVDILKSYIIGGYFYSLKDNVLISLMMIQMLVYFVISIYHLHSYEQNYKRASSDNDISYLTMVKNTIWIFSAYFFLEFTYATYRNYFGTPNKFLEDWSLIVWVLFMMAISYLFIRQPHILHYTPSKKLTGDLTKKDINDLDKTIEQITNVMTNQKPFLNSSLTLLDLSKLVGVSPHHLSFILNNHFKVNFYHFVNTYRVKEVANELKSGRYKQYSIFGIAQSMGFKSKASFYKFFKDCYGMTPSKYIDLINSSDDF